VSREAEESVAVVRELYSVVERDDFGAALQLFHPDVHWEPTEGTFHGLEGVGRSFVEWMEPWDEHRVELEEAIGAGDRVLATVRLTARGEQSGVEIDQRFFQVHTIREGKIVRMVEYLDRKPAAEAAGVS
jgi:ketosteroid isomerase-like protein